jgi:hypothetical protein
LNDDFDLILIFAEVLISAGLANNDSIGVPMPFFARFHRYDGSSCSDYGLFLPVAFGKRKLYLTSVRNTAMMERCISSIFNLSEVYSSIRRGGFALINEFFTESGNALITTKSFL